jgi:O-antigen ligase
LCIVTGRLGLERPWFHRLALVFGTTGLILSFSRGAWVSTIVALLAYCWILLRWKVFSLKKTLATASVMLLLFLPTLPFISARLTSDDHNAAMSRVPLMSIAWNMIKAHPLVGIGGNTYVSVIRDYVPQDYTQGYVDQVHNLYLLVFAECGIVGLAAILWLFGSILIQSRECAEYGKDEVVRHLGAAVFVIAVQMACFAIIDMNNHKVAVSTLFLLCALLQFAMRLEHGDTAEMTI